MTSEEKAFYAVVSLVLGLLAVGSYWLTNEAGFGVLFGAMSFLALIKCTELNKWFD